jgi:hypothetical protein
MFTVDCPRHGGRVLIWPSGIDGIDNVDGCIEVRYHCTCGHRGVWVTGRRACPSCSSAQGLELGQRAG